MRVLRMGEEKAAWIFLLTHTHAVTRVMNHVITHAMNHAFDTLISYARQDETIARDLQQRLGDAGITCWRDHDQIGPTEYEFTQKIAEGIDQSRTVLLLISNNYLSSYYCFQELVNALMTAPPASCVVLPVLVDETLAGHPICELTGGRSVSLLVPDTVEQVAAWIRLPGHGRTQRNADAFDLSTQAYLNHVRNGSYSARSRSYAESVIGRYCQLEILLHLINADALHEVEEALPTLHDQISGDASAPMHLKDAARSRLAYMYSALGQYEKVLPIRREIFTSGTLARGRQNFETISQANALIHTLARAGRLDEAMELATKNLVVSTSHFSKDHALSIMAANTMGGLLADQGRYDDAIGYLAPAYKALDAGTFSADSDEHLSLAMNYGFACMRTGNEALAWTVLSKVHDAYIRKFGDGHIDTAQVQIKLAECLLRMDRNEEADAMAQKAMATFSTRDVTHPLRVFGSITALQCAHAHGNALEKKKLFDQHIEPLLATGHPLGEQISDFLSENPELRPFDATQFIRKIKAEADDADTDSTSLWLNIAWDGAVNYGDAYCTLVIAAAQMNPDTFTKLQKALRPRRLRLPEPADPQSWFRKVASQEAGEEDQAAAFAARMLDSDRPLAGRKEACRKLIENIHKIVPESEYFSNPVKFGHLPGKLF